MFFDTSLSRRFAVLKRHGRCLPPAKNEREERQTGEKYTSKVPDSRQSSRSDLVYLPNTQQTGGPPPTFTAASANHSLDSFY